MTLGPVPPSGSTGGEAEVPVNRLARLSLGLGVLGFACALVFWFGGLVLAVPALTCGVHARREIAASGGSQAGDNIAVYGLVFGSSAVVLAVVSAVLALMNGTF